MRYKGRKILLMNAKGNLGWGYHIPTDYRMDEPNLSLAIHTHAIFQELLWELNQKN